VLAHGRQPDCPSHLDAGHAGAAGRFDRLREVALAYAFAIKVAVAAL
jgi:protease II